MCAATTDDTAGLASHPKSLVAALTATFMPATDIATNPAALIATFKDTATICTAAIAPAATLEAAATFASAAFASTTVAATLHAPRRDTDCSIVTVPTSTRTSVTRISTRIFTRTTTRIATRTTTCTPTRTATLTATATAAGAASTRATGATTCLARPDFAFCAAGGHRATDLAAEFTRAPSLSRPRRAHGLAR